MNLETAGKIINAAVTHARDGGFRPLTIVVLDAGAHLIAMKRQDGATFGRFDVAFGKAAGALAMGTPSRTIEKLAMERPHFIGAVSAARAGKVIPVAGGVLAYDADGEVIGAVGISGDTSDNDENAGMAGLKAAGLLQNA